MYILEAIHINKNEDLFFEDVKVLPNELEEEMREFYKRVAEKTAHHIYKKNLMLSVDRYQLSNGSYAINYKRKYFKSIQGVEEYWRTYFYEYSSIDLATSKITRYKKDWAKEHDIRTEANILDINGNFIKTVNSCEQGICGRFDDKNCSPDAHCWEKHEVKTNVSYHHVPISSIKRRSNRE